MSQPDSHGTLAPDVLLPDDSALGSDNETTASGSIGSSVIAYKYENGRRYHAYHEGSYYLPNDDAEQDRLDLLHHIFLVALDGALFLAPLDKSQIKRCIDFGTGTGIWAIDFADEFPEAEVVGTDLSPIQPGWVPPNLKFFVDDVEDDWNYRPDEGFDFIHGRGMGGSIKDWNRLFKHIYDNTKPGGYVELQEYEARFFSESDPTFSKCPDTRKWVDLVNEASSQFGKDVDMAPKIKGLMKDAGFVDVQETIMRIPLGPWAKGKKYKEMGIFQRENILAAVDSYTYPLFTRVLGWSVEDCDAFVEKLKKEIWDPGNQLYARYYFVHGRREN